MAGGGGAIVGACYGARLAHECGVSGVDGGCAGAGRQAGGGGGGKYRLLRVPASRRSDGARVRRFAVKGW